MRIGPYETLAELGRGGGGAVFRARGADGRDVAVKVLLRLDERRRARFDRERRLLASFGEADGFVPLLDTGDCEHGPFIVMPLLPGGTLRQRLAKGRLGVAESVALGVRLAGALARAHERGIVHRDLKPENVLFSGPAAPGTAFVADLGLAKHFDDLAPGASQSVSLSRAGDLRGTPGYLAPEQVKDAKSAGPPADVFALGAIVYECLAGGPAFQADSAVELLANIDTIDPKPLPLARPDTPRWLVGVVERCLAKTAAARFRDAGELRAALERGAAKAAKEKSPARSLAVLGVLLALAVAGAASLVLRARDAGSNAELIEPGRGVGAVTIGKTTDAEALAALGEAAAVGTDLAVLDAKGKVAALVHRGRVAQLSVRTTAPRTRGGSGVGSLEAEVVAELGAGARRDQLSLVYDELGVAFDLVASTRAVERVLVFARPSGPGPDLAKTKHLIVPGRGVDRVVVGRSKLEELQAAFGSDGALVEEGGVARFTYLRDANGAWLPGRPANARRPTVATIRDGVVADLAISGVAASELRTERGIALGAGRDAVRGELGAPDDEVLRVTSSEGAATWFYDVLGIAVTFDGRGTVRELTLFPAERPERLLIVPGSGVAGVVAEKSSAADVLRALGADGKVVRPRDGQSPRIEYRSGIEWLDRRRPARLELKSDTVHYIVLGRASRALATREGVRIGSPRDLVDRAYGKPFGSFHDRTGDGLTGDTFYWPDRGVNVHIADRTGEVDEISISTAAKRP